MAVSLPPALEPFLGLMRCPTCCTAGMREDDGALCCPARHTFDIARHGYVSLLTGRRATSGDDAAMARARMRFLSTGTYAPIRDLVIRLAADAVSDHATVVDSGCGDGYYLTGLLDQLPRARGLGLDTSVRALRSAAQTHERAAAAMWDVFRPFPLVSGAADVVMDVFAPRNPAEFNRVLRPTGRLIVVRPRRQHLSELRNCLPVMVAVDPTKEQRLHRALNPFFESVMTEEVERTMPVTRQQALDLIGMTPTARHLDREDLNDGALLPDHVTLSVRATAYQPR